MTTLVRLNKIKKKAIFFDKKINLFTKFYIEENKKTRKLILQESHGLNWYFGRLNKYHNKTFSFTNDSNALNIQIIKGDHIKYWKSFFTQINKVERIINHYLLLWPHKRFVPYHGDLTIENIIFVSKTYPIIIDWENFENKECWGLDLSYFLISLLVLPIISKQKIKIYDNEVLEIRKIWRNIFKKKKLAFLKDPITYIKNKNKENFFNEITPNLKKKIEMIF